MRVLISGASGFIGSALTEYLTGRGHDPVPLERGPRRAGQPTWSVERETVDPGAMDGVDAVVHLAGRPIAPPFTRSRKREIMGSRRIGTSVVADAVAAGDPRVFLCASAIGYYGSRGDTKLTEASGPGDGFLSRVAQAWEAACAPARESGVRTVNLRSALVLGGSGGLLPLMAIPFRLGLGGPLGTGEQWWSWIALEDEVRAIVHCLETDTVEGAVNLASPDPVRNRTFVQALADALGRPCWLRVPSFLLRLVLGQEATRDLVLSSQRVLPKKLTDSGFEFRQGELRAALRAALGPRH